MEIPEDRCLICGELGHSGCIGTLLEQQEFDRQAAHREFCATLAARDAEIKRRGHAMQRARQRISEWHDLLDSEADLDDSAGDGVSVREVVMKEMEETRSGLLAAIDEATQETSDPR